MGQSSTKLDEVMDYDRTLTQEQYMAQAKVAEATQHALDLGLTKRHFLNNPYNYRNGVMSGFGYRSLQCGAQSDVARCMSIYKDKEQDAVKKAVKVAHDLGIPDTLLFDANPHKWQDGHYRAYGAMLWHSPYSN
jgi:hypothetical protein